MYENYCTFRASVTDPKVSGDTVQTQKTKDPSIHPAKKSMAKWYSQRIATPMWNVHHTPSIPDHSPVCPPALHNSLPEEAARGTTLRGGRVEFKHGLQSPATGSL